jgi:outer membrane protein TolC
VRDIRNAYCYTCLEMKAKICIAAACLIAGAAAISAGAQDADQALSKVIDLREAIDSALAGGDDMRIAKANLDAATAQHALNLSKNGVALAATGSYAPVDGFGQAADLSALQLGKASGIGQSISGGLNLSLGNASPTNPYSKLSLAVTQSIPPPSAPPSSSSTLMSASLAQTLWDGYPGGQTKAAIDKSALTLQGKRLATDQSRSATIAKVKQAYVAMLGAQRTLSLRQGIFNKQDGLRKQIEAVFALKQASAIDIQTARINATSAELDVEASRHDLSLARQRLANLMGLAADSAFDVAETETPEFPAPSVDEAISIGLSKRVDAAQIELGKKSALVDVALAKAGAQPSVSIAAGFSLGMIEASSPALASSASLGLKIGMPLLDAGAASAQIAATRAQIEAFDAQAAQLRETIAADIRDAYWTVQIQAERVSLAKDSQDMYEKTLELVKAQNQYGTATNQDLLTAQVNAANAEVGYLAAKSTYLLAELALETAMGL